MYRTFEENERLAYMSNLPKIAKLYAQLDDDEQSDGIEELQQALNRKNRHIRVLENKINQIEDIISG